MSARSDMTTKIKMTNNELPPFTSLVGQILIAMPGIDDDRFDQAVIYVCSHTEEEGAIGLVINHPANQLTLKDITMQLQIEPLPDRADKPLFIGGPDQITRGFVLHSDDYRSVSTCSVADGISLTATQDIIKDIATGNGPRNSLIALGRSNWIRGQLEEEIMTNVWLTANPTYDLIFNTPYPKQWSAALALLGVQPELLAASAGKA